MDRTVLVVEDDKGLQELIRMALASSGIQCELAGSGDEAMAILNTTQPAAVILDFNLGGSVNGIEICRRIKRDSSLNKILVIMVSGADEEKDALAAGADDFLLKPFSPIQLRDRIAQSLA
jgi:DNA-binding response OmpR family regulator